MLKEIVKRGLLGFMIGVFIGETILIINSVIAGQGIFYPLNSMLISREGTQLTRVIIQYFLTGVIGMSFSASSIFFEIDKWSFVKQTFIHFVINSVVMYVCGFFCNWFERTVLATVIWFGIYIVIYILFWLNFTIYYKVMLKKINKSL